MERNITNIDSLILSFLEITIMTIEKHERSTKDLVKAAVSGWLGTALEFMDFKSHTCQLFDKY